MEYNTSRKHLAIPEYGRHIQKMIDHAVALENKEERNKAVQTVIDIMSNLNTPNVRDVADFKQKLWNHLHIMSDFQLDVDSPYEKPVKEVLNKKPERLSYSDKDIAYKHYGRTIELLIEKVISIEDEEKKNSLVEVIANHMKKSYVHWNKNYVNDDVIIAQLKEISKGKLNVPENLRLNRASSGDSTNKTKKRVKPSRSNNGAPSRKK